MPPTSRIKQALKSHAVAVHLRQPPKGMPYSPAQAHPAGLTQHQRKGQ
eukprot:CAMPEP_0183343734 /NCGR_PEP_ID=MMETSP0164_2-20130417/9568_1 /TAXON_ID=221442 /ORGANISM="Coccolithus pelagicus ssp braarudi, Strain PLY182g" /LENGTH=47 /DNA_ID= /DNA_START= /DNA_END= /DNA_ORIENTATION=